MLWGPFRTFKELLREDPRIPGLCAAWPPHSRLGADTEAVLTELGEDVAALRREGVIR